MERMREDEKQRHANETPKPSTDQSDLQKFKSGGPSDRNADPSAVTTRKG